MLVCLILQLIEFYIISVNNTNDYVCASVIDKALGAESVSDTMVSKFDAIFHKKIADLAELHLKMNCMGSADV